jgi:hypothetical protein
MDTWTPLVTREETKPNLLFANQLEHFPSVPNGEMESDRRMVPPELSEDFWNKMGRTGGASGKFQNSRQVAGLVNLA